MVSGELWLERGGLFVRDGSTFYRMNRTLLPPNAHEYDIVDVQVDGMRVVKVDSIRRATITRRPPGFKPAENLRVGRVSDYSSGKGGIIDSKHPFDASVVKAFRRAEVRINELIEYSINNNVVNLVQGPFGTHVSMDGARLS
jgi:hypothetical protein